MYLLTRAACFLFLWTGLAPTPPEKAAELLNRSQTRLMSLQGIELDFRSRIAIPGLTETIRQQGSIRFSQGRYVVQTDQEAIYCNLGQQWLVDLAGNTYQVAPYDPDHDLTLEVIFQLFRNRQQASYEGLETVEGRPCHRIFIPLADSRLDHTQAVVWMDPTTFMLAKVTLIDRRQATTTYWFSELRTGADFSPQAFTFDAARYPGMRRRW